MKINKLLESKKLNEDVMSNISVNGKKLIQYLEQNKFTKSGDGKKSLVYTKTEDKNSMVVSFTELDIRVKLTADGKTQEVPFKHKEAAKAYKVIKQNLDRVESGKFKAKVGGDGKVTVPKNAKEIESAPLRQTYKSKAGTFKKVNTSTWEFTPAKGGDSKQIKTANVVNHFFPTNSSEKRDENGKTQKDELGNTKYKKGSGIIGQRFKNVNSHLIKLLKNKYDVQSVSLKDKNTFLAYTSRGKQIKVGVEPTKENKKGEIIEYQIKSIKESLQNDRRPGMKINKLLESKKLKEGYSHFEFTSGSNPYIAKTKDEAERIKRSRGDSVKYVGNINGIDYYKVDDSEEDLFRVDESVQMTNDELVDILEKSRYTSFVVDEGDYIKIQGTWRPNSRKCHNDYVGISSLLDKKLGNENFDLVYEENTSRDGGNEFSCKLRLKVKQLKEGWYEDHLDTIQRKTSGYYKCYKIVKKARTSNPIDIDALDDARDHFGYDLFKMCLDDVLKEMDNLDESFNDFRTDDGSYYIIGDHHYFEPNGIPTMKSEISIKDYRRAYNNRKLNKDGTDNLDEASIPRNATRLRATHRYGDKETMELSKDGTYWRTGNDNKVYPSDYLRKYYDVEVLDTDPNYKPNRTKPEYVVQGNYGYGWEDLTASDNQAEARNDLKAYRENETGVPHRLITRRVPVTENLKEAFKPSDSGIQSVKCYNRYNYTIQELRVDNDNKTFERGQFTVGKPDKKTKNRQEFEDVVDNLKALGYTEIKSDYQSMRNKTRNGVVQESTSSEKSLKETYWIDNIKAVCDDGKTRPIDNDTKSDAYKMMNEASYGKNYRKSWSDDGSVYSQTYYISNDEYQQIMKAIEDYKDNDYGNDNIYGKYDSLKNRLTAKDGEIHPGLTAARLVKDVLGLENFKFDRNVRFVINDKKANASMNEASYGGAYDIEDDQYFTKDDLLYFAEEVLGHISETFEGKYDIGGVWFEDGCVVTQIVDEDGNMYEDTTRVDMRKIKEPWHLKRAYGQQVSANIIQQIKEMSESVVSSSHEFDDDVDGLSYYYDDEMFKDNLENSPYTEIASKSVPDMDGFMTDYTMYQNVNTGEYVFVFGDKDIYTPDDGYFDYECETKEEAEEWFSSYCGFGECESDWLDEAIESESPIVHKKSDGSYIVASDDKQSYIAFGKDDKRIGAITAANENEAKTKFNANQFDKPDTKPQA